MIAPRVNFVLDDESLQSAKKKRPFTTSALIRFWLKVLFYTDDRLFKLKKTDEEFRAIMLYTAPKLAALVESMKIEIKDMNKP